MPVISVRAFAAAFACAALASALATATPVPAAADPVVIQAPDYVPRGRAVTRAQAYGEDEVRVIRPERRTYGRRAYVEDIFEDDDGYYERRPRRIPTYRERVRGYDRDYEAIAPRRTYGRDYRARRYYEDGDYGYESVDPDVERLPRRLAGPPSTYGAGETRRAMDPKFARTTVPYKGSEPANSIVIDTRTRFLYLVQGDGTAIRYGVGVGKEGFTWKGVEKISAKREWPDWHPPAEMRQRRPELPVMMAGGPDNPLGARALYLGKTLYRIHGSNEPWTIGRAVSSGCIRMTNEDVTDLYDRVGVGTTVKVL
jgi:lipoprotein-anchoring transpeptidase ErfK/SrfK